MGYHSELFVFDGERPIRAVIRNYRQSDFKELKILQSLCFPPPFPPELLWNDAQLTNHVTLFGEGALCMEIDGEIAGSLTGMRLHSSDIQDGHDWENVTNRGYITNHRPDGNILYIVDISVAPKCRKYGAGKMMMQAMYQVVVQNDIDLLLGGGRMPGYHKYASILTPEQYLEKIISGELRDPVITFLLKAGRTPVSIVKNYLEDEESLHHGVLMEWKNPFK